MLLEHCLDGVGETFDAGACTCALGRQQDQPTVTQTSHETLGGKRTEVLRAARTSARINDMQDLERLAELAVVVGANVQVGQVVRVSAELAQIELVRAVADAAYRHGAQFVEVDLRDPVLRRSQVLYTRGEPRGRLPTGREEGFRELEQIGGALIMIHGPTAPGLFDDLDPVRVNQAQPPSSRAWRAVEYRINNTIIPGPNGSWAQAIHPDRPPAEALATLWRQITIACRLDQADALATWRTRFSELRDRAEALTALGLDAVRLRGPETDLRLGLIPSGRWEPPTNVNESGIEHAWNLPSEEIYTSPDPSRVEGHVRLTRPALVGGRLIDDVTLRFRAGQVIDVEGGHGVQALREFIARDSGTARLGELAFVDGDSAVGHLGQTFGMIMLDENAASHIALGFGFPELVDAVDRDRVNQSGDHLDVIVGSDDLEIVGIDLTGHEVPLLRAGQWQFATCR